MLCDNFICVRRYNHVVVQTEHPSQPKTLCRQRPFQKIWIQETEPSSQPVKANTSHSTRYVLSMRWMKWETRKTLMGCTICSRITRKRLARSSILFDGQVVAPSIALRACSLRQVWLIERIAPSLECTLTGPTQFFVTSLKLTLCVPLEKHWGWHKSVLRRIWEFRFPRCNAMKLFVCEYLKACCSTTLIY